MLNMIVSKNLAFGAGLDADLTKDGVGDLTDGAITLSRSDTNEVLKAGGAGDAVFDTDFRYDTLVQFIQRTADAVLLSNLINPKTLTWEKQVYAAPVAKVVHVGRNASALTWTLPADLTDRVGQSAQIRIVDLSMPHEITNNQVAVEYTIVQGDTHATVHNKLFAKLEKYKGKFYANVEKNVSTTNYGYKFTGIVGKNIEIHAELLLAGSPITVATPINFGKGLAVDLLKLEKKVATHKGYNPSDAAPAELYTGEFFIDLGTNYDVYTLRWTNPNHHRIASGDDPMIQHCYICAPTAQAISAHIEKVLLAIKDQATLWASAT